MSVNSDMDNASVARRDNQNNPNDSLATYSDNNSDISKSDKSDKADSKLGESIDDNLNNKSAGGASAVKEEQEEEQEKEKKKGKNNLNKAQGAMGALQGANSAMTSLNLIMMVKLMFSSIGAGVASAAQGIFGFFIGIAQNVGAAVSGFVSGVASFLGTTSAVVGSVFSAIGSFAVTGVCVVAVASNATTAAVRDAPRVINCAVDVNQSIGDIEVDIDAQTLANAQQIYSVYRQAGFSNTHIAGILGNFQQENHGFDPTSVEAIFDEPYTIGPRKQEAIDCNFDTHVYVPDYQYQYPFPAGIGIGGYTAENNTALREYAASHNRDWWDLGVQIAFGMYEYASSGWLNDTYKNTSYPNPRAAAEAFMNGYERPAAASANLDGRMGYAEQWYTAMSEWNVDVNYANSVLAMAQTAGSNGDNLGAASMLNGCQSARSYDNSSIASAAVSFAWETREMGVGNNGTELYQAVHDDVFTGDTTYASCDRCVGTAVRWSGADDNYPAGNVENQLNHCISSSKWTEVTNWNGDRANLQPGDIIFEGANSRGHTLMYVGNEMIKAKYPNADAAYCLVSASINERSPGCQEWYPADNRRVFRNVEKETNSIYTDAGSSAN